LPDLLGVFDDGTSAGLSQSLRVNRSLPSGAESILKIDEKQGIKAVLSIPEPQALPLEFSLQQFPNVKTELLITAADALPEITLNIEGQPEVGGALNVVGLATDDVGIKYVEFWLDGSAIGQRP